MNKILLLFKSRKFWAAFIGLVMVILTSFVPDFPLPEDQVLNLVLVIVSYILGTALEDGLTNTRKIN